jgi:hypothetical protein
MDHSTYPSGRDEMSGVLVLISLFLANQTSLDFLAESDSEWVAPGWEVFEEIDIDPLDYVEPMYYGPYSVACQAFEVMTDTGSRTWRVVMCGSDKLVVLQGNREEALELEMPFQSFAVQFSQNGRYALVEGYSGPGVNGAVLVDIEEMRAGDVFDPDPSGQPFSYLVSNNGDVVSLFFPSGLEMVFAGRDGRIPLDPTDWVVPRYPMVSPEGDRIFTGLQRNGSETFGALDLDGRILWTTDTGEAHPRGDAVVSPDGSLVYVCLSDNRLLVLDGFDGSVIAEEQMEGTPHVDLCASNGTVLVSGESDDGVFVGIQVGLCTDSSRMTIGETLLSSCPILWSSSAADGAMQAVLLGECSCDGMPNSPSTRSVLIGSDGSLIWVSECLAVRDRSFTPHGNQNLEIQLSGFPYATASSGDSVFVVSTLKGLTIHGIRGAR